MKANFVKKRLISVLKSTGKQFHDGEGNPITVEEFAEILCKMKVKDLQDMQKEIKENEKK